MNKTSIIFPTYQAPCRSQTLLSAEVAVLGGTEPPLSLYFIPEGQSVVVDEGANFIIVDNVAVYGELTVYGRAVEVLT